MGNRKTVKVTTKGKFNKTGKSKNIKRQRVRGGETTKKDLIKLDVHLTKATNGDKGKIEINVRTFHEFRDYLNEVDAFLKNTLNDELLAFTEPKKYTDRKNESKTEIKSYRVEKQQSVENK